MKLHICIFRQIHGMWRLTTKVPPLCLCMRSRVLLSFAGSPCMTTAMAITTRRRHRFHRRQVYDTLNRRSRVGVPRLHHRHHLPRCASPRNRDARMAMVRPLVKRQQRHRTSTAQMYSRSSRTAWRSSTVRYLESARATTIAAHSTHTIPTTARGTAHCTGTRYSTKSLSGMLCI